VKSAHRFSEEGREGGFYDLAACANGGDLGDWGPPSRHSIEFLQTACVCLCRFCLWSWQDPRPSFGHRRRSWLSRRKSMTL
jgi:hypothetical protein